MAASTNKVRNGFVTAFALPVTVSVAWLLYSRFRINHRVHLSAALPAERKTLISPSAGHLIYYRDNHAAGTPLVLLHSINAAASSYELRPLFQHYRAARPVYALDLPGFGFSERANVRYTPRLYTQAIADFLAAEVGQPADVIALSLTSEFAARAAVENPSLFRSLTMISPTGLSTKQEAMSGGHSLLRRMLLFPVWSQALFDLLATQESIHAFLERSFVGEVDKVLDSYAYETTHQPGARYAPFAFVSGCLFSPDIRTAVYDKLTIPVCVLYDEDPYVSFERLPDLLTSHPNWHAERLIPTRGLPHFEKLDETASDLDRFWSSVNPG